MKFIKSSFEILDQIPSIDGIYRQIELTGRVSYKSEDKITEDSVKKFVDMLIKRGYTGCKAQEASEILPLCTKTELIMTKTVEQWKKFFKLRTSITAHPQIRELAISLKEEFIKRNLLDEND